MILANAKLAKLENGIRNLSKLIKRCYLRLSWRQTTLTSKLYCKVFFFILVKPPCLIVYSLDSDVGCKTVANMIKGKTPEEIRKLFNIVNDFTPEEEVRR